MNKLFTKIATACVGLAMAVGVGVAVGNTSVQKASAANAWNQITSLNDISNNDEILIANADYYLPAVNFAAKNSGGAAFTITDGTLANPVWKVTVSNNSYKFSVVVSNTTYYLYVTNDNNGVVSGSGNTPAGKTWSIEKHSTENTFMLTSSDGSNTRYLAYASGNFRCYKTSGTTGDKYCTLYKRAAVSQTYTVSFNANGGTGTMASVPGQSGSYTLPANGFTAPSNKVFAGWKANNAGNVIASGGSYTVSADVEFFAQWADAYTVTYTAGTNGSGSYSHTLQPAGSYTLLQFANLTGVSASSGYRFKNYTVGGVNKNPGDTITLSGATSVTVNFEEQPSEVSITYSSYSSNLPSSGYSAIDWTADGIDGKIYTIKNDNSAIQFQQNASYVYNTKAIPGYIKSITIAKYSGSYTLLTAFVADAEGGSIETKPDSGGTNNNTNWTWTFDPDDHYCFFRIDSTSSGAKYFSSITIDYEKVTTVDPTGITLNDDSDISMDTYGYGRRKLVATVQPFNNNDGTVNWGTTNSSVVTVSDGVLTAKGIGSASVYATTGNYVDDSTTPDLKVSVDVTVSQALYKKATFLPTSASAASQADDYLNAGSVELSTTGQFSTDKSMNAIQLSNGKSGATSATFTISGYAGMKITGIDLIMSSNGNAGSGSLTVTAGSTEILEIETAAFSDASWNGAYEANPTDLYKPTTEYVVNNNETIEFVFAASVSSIYIHSVSIRYLDYSLEQWCENFLSQITCTGATQQYPDGAIVSDTNWGTLSTAFGGLSKDLRDIAAVANANKDSDSVIERAMARYDLILRKYGIGTGEGQHTDFIGRFGVGKVNGPLNASQAIFGTNDSSTTSIIVIVSLIGVTAIGGYFFLRKKKHQ